MKRFIEKDMINENCKVLIERFVDEKTFIPHRSLTFVVSMETSKEEKLKIYKECSNKLKDFFEGDDTTSNSEALT